MHIGNIQDELNNKVVIITGGNKGIGYGIAKAFCTYGARVTIAARDENTGNAVAEELTATTSGTCVFIKCDIADSNQVKLMIDDTVLRFGRLDCIVNNAGYFPRRCPIDEMSGEDMLQVMQINLGGVFFCTKAALPYLRASHGSIINISSVLGHSGQEGAALYAASKAAIIAFTKSIACDEARNGVRVNVLNPGDIRSGINDKEAGNADNKRKSNNSERIHLIERQGEPEEIGTACLFLASSWASFMTGSELSVDGGYFAGHGFKRQAFNWSDIMQIKDF